MQTRNSNQGSRSDRNRPNFRAAALLLGIYTAIYLVVAGLVHFMTSPDAAAAMVRIGTAAPAVVTTVPVEATDAAGESTPARSLDPAADETDNSRECQLDAGVDPECIFN